MNHPKTGIETNVEIGYPLLSKSKVMSRKAVQLLEEISANGNPLNPNQGGMRVELKPGMYVLKKSDGIWDFYFPQEPELVTTKALGKVVGFQSGLCLNRNSGELKLHMDSWTLLTPPREVRYQETRVTSVDEARHKKELLYNGKFGSNIRLTYREFVDDLSRPAFTQELNYDLNESKVIGFQGVRIEVIATDNVGIKYRVIKGFPDPVF